MFKGTGFEIKKAQIFTHNQLYISWDKNLMNWNCDRVIGHSDSTVIGICLARG